MLIVGVENEEVSDLIKSLCLTLIIQIESHNEQPGLYDKGLLSILELFGNAMELIEDKENEIVKAQSVSESKMLEKVDELDDEHEEGTLVRRSSQGKRRNHDYSTDGTNKTKSKRIGSQMRPSSGEDNMAIVPYLKQKPKKRNERKVFDDLEKIRRQKEEQQKAKNLEKEKLRIIDEKKKKKLKKQIELRRVELGIQKRTGEEDQSAMIFKEGEVEKTAGFNDFLAKGLTSNAFNMSSASKFSKLGGIVKRIQDNMKGQELLLFEYDVEEQRDVDAVKMVAKKYTKLFKFLFDKYANSGYSVQAFRNFEELNKKMQTITIAEIMKMLRDHHVTNRIISKSNVSEIVRRIQPNSTLLPLTYSLFVEFFIQLAFVIHSYPPADGLLKLIKFFEDSARSRGQSTLLYEDPDATTLGDRKVIDELNRRIKVNPSYSLPEGYSKVIERDFNYEYTLPKYYNITEGQRVAIHILDDL